MAPIVPGVIGFRAGGGASGTIAVEQLSLVVVANDAVAVSAPVGAVAVTASVGVTALEVP